jgi:LmbE family N-acetylglucosaminyl deacetylase
MLRLDFARPPSKILCLGSHSDDIEIGCGGAVLRLLATHTDLTVWWVVFAAQGERGQEARAGADLFLSDAGDRRVILEEFRDGFFPYTAAAIKETFERLKGEYQPDLVFTHYRDDRHQDHRLISDLTWNTFRNHLILEYEIPKYDGDLGSPNLFLPLDAATLARKVEYLQRCFNSQRSKHWFTDDLFYALPRLRGMEANAPNHYAEAFYCRKLTL